MNVSFIEAPKLLQVLEFIDDVLPLGIRIDRRQRFQVPDQDILPVELLRARHPVVAFQEREEVRREIL